MTIDDQVLYFYHKLFENLFSEPFRKDISERRRLNKVLRQVEEVADAASSSLTRFFLNQKLSEETVTTILESFTTINSLLKLEHISNSNVTTEGIVENLLPNLPFPQGKQTKDPIYTVALFTIIQVLMQVGPIIGEN